MIQSLDRDYSSMSINICTSSVLNLALRYLIARGINLEDDNQYVGTITRQFLGYVVVLTGLVPITHSLRGVGFHQFNFVLSTYRSLIPPLKIDRRMTWIVQFE